MCVYGGSIRLDSLHQTEAKEVEILKYLDHYNDQWIQSEDIARKLSYGKATVQKNVRNIQSRLKELSIDGISLESSPSKGILFSRYPEVSLHRVIENIYKHSFNFSLINSIFHETISSLHLFSIDHYFSIASVKRAISVLNKILRKSNICIKLNQFVGDEYSIRSFLFKYYWEIFKGMSWPFKSIDKEKIISFLNHFNEESGLFHTIISQEQICYFFAVSRIRWLKGHAVTFDKEIHDFASSHSRYDEFEKLWQLHFPFNQLPLEEKHYCFYILYSFSFDVGRLSEDRVNEVCKIFSESTTVSTYLTLSVIQRFSSFFSIKISPTDKIDLVMLHHKAHLLRCTNCLAPSSGYLSELKNDFPYFCDVIYHQTELFLGVNSDVIFDKNIILEGYTLFLYDIIDFGVFAKEVKVAIMFSGGSLNEKKLAKQLQIKYSDKMIFDFVSSNEEHDVLITDTPMFLDSSKKRIYIEGTFLSDIDYQFLEETFDELENQPLFVTK